MNDVKPILSIETSGSLCSAAVYFSDEKYFSSSVMLRYSHSEKLFGIIELLFKQAELDQSQIGSIAVSGGPGSFTGLRIGMAAAKGIATGSAVPIVVVPTFEALAYKLSLILEDNSEFIIANRVNKEEVYYAKFKIKANNYIFTDILAILTVEDFINKAMDLKVFGDADYYISGEKYHSDQNAPSALDIAKWALKFGIEDFTYDFDYLEPNYLKYFIVKERQKE